MSTETYAIRLTAEQLQVLDCILGTHLAEGKEYYRYTLGVDDSNDKLRASTNMAFSHAVDEIKYDQLMPILDQLGLND